MQQRPKILVVGSFVMDLIVSTNKFPNAGETVLGSNFQTAPGGKGANQAVQAARLGADVTIVGKVGNDDFGKSLIRSCNEAGIHTEYVMIHPTVPSAVGNIQLEVSEKDTQNRIIVVSGANMTITPEDVAFLKDSIAQYDMVILQLEIPMLINEIVSKYAFDKGVPFMLNSAPSSPLSDKLLSCLSYISPNEHEAADLTGIKIRKDGKKVNQDDVKAAVNALLGKGVQNVIITLGNSGAVVANAKESTYRPCVDVVDVKDPTAAGDSFVGAFCVGVCAGLNQSQALDFANYTAAVTVSRMGAQPSLPMLTEVVELMMSLYNMIPENSKKTLKEFITVSKEEFEAFTKTISSDCYDESVDLILDAQKKGCRVHITGIGKPGHVAAYIASLMSSTGTPTYFLHGTEAVHGSCGQLVEGDVVICISNSGETSELKATVNAIKNNGCKVIAVTGNRNSWLAKESHACLFAGVTKEGGPLNRAPRSSILAEVFVLQGLSVVLTGDSRANASRLR